MEKQIPARISFGSTPTIIRRPGDDSLYIVLEAVVNRPALALAPTVTQKGVLNLAPGLAVVGNHAVPDVDHPMRVLGNVVFVGHQHDGIALRV